MIRRIFFRVIAVSVSLLTSWLVLEGAIRLLIPAEYWRFADATDDWTTDPRLGWVQTGDLRLVSSAAPPIQTNPDGLLPGTAVRTKSAAWRILLVGDSTVVGRCVSEPERIHGVLSTLLRAKGFEVEVLNAGVQGYSTDQALLRLESLLPLYKPDVVFYAFCTNDLAGNSSSTAYRMGKPWFQLDEHGKLHQHNFQMTPVPKSMVHGPRMWMQNSAVYRLCQPSILRIRAAFGGWEERMLMNPEDFYTDPNACNQFDWKLLEALLERMQLSCREHGCQFGFYAHPALEEVWEPMVNKAQTQSPAYNRYAIEERLKVLADRSQLHFCRMIDHFVQNQSRGPFHLLPRDPHCNANGYRLQAEILLAFLVEHGLVSGSTTQQTGFISKLMLDPSVPL